MAYDFRVAIALCDKHGLVFNRDLADRAEGYFNAAGLNQDQADLMIELLCRFVCHTWDRTVYPWYVRMFLALYFLAVGKRLKSW